MKLIRNTTPDGSCKYAIVRLDRIRKLNGKKQSAKRKKIEQLLVALTKEGVLEFGRPGTEEEHFVIKLKDRFALSALLAYAREVRIEASSFRTGGTMKSDLIQYADEIEDLARRSLNHQNRKMPTP